MNRKKSRTVPALLAVLLSAALLGGCGNNASEVQPASGVLTGATAVGINVCATCHTVQTGDWLTSKHANAVNGLASAGSPTLGGNYTVPACGQCHDPNGDSANIIAAGYIGSVARPVVGCEACHGGGSLHYGSGPISLLSNTTGTIFGTVPVSAQLVMCTSCHQLLDPSTGALAAAASVAHDPSGPISQSTGTLYTITDTHFATPGVFTGGASGSENTVFITGYAMDFGDERVCTTCHNPHKPATQNREWALSAHADKNFENLNSLGTGYFSGAWAHYNWSEQTSTRLPCQRCHTTTVFAAYADALRSGNTRRAHDIKEGLASLLTFTTGFKPEMLKCNGCHTDNRGTLRNPGPITANYDYPVPVPAGGKPNAVTSHTYPDLAGSNVCMTCHVGRESGDTIKGLNDPALLSAGTITSFNFGNASFVNSHYLTAGGQLFTTTGYEFDGRPYNNIDEYLHDKIGTRATKRVWPFVDTGSNGPCIGCHMSRPNKNGNHLFLPVSRSTINIGEITGIASEVCFSCHGPSSTLILDLVEEQRKQFIESLEALKDQIRQHLGYYFFPYSPYWYKTTPYFVTKTDCDQNVPVKNWQTLGTQSVLASFPTCTYTGDKNGASGTGPNNMGAAFNFNLLEHDPGAFVHNRMYTKRLIYDSIDWVDNGVMNYSTGTTLCSECALTCTGSGGDAGTWCPEAMTYLLPNGVYGNETEAERP